jgi:tetratricopeptide (TPR) repeat protein
MEALQKVQAGDFAGAQESFNLAIASDPQNPTAHTYLCFLSFRKGDFPAARGSCDKAIAINAQIPLALLVSARIDDANGEVGKAIAGYNAAAEAGMRNKENADAGGREVAGHARYLRALLEAKQGDHLAALSDLDRAIRIFPQNAYASYEGGLSLLALTRNEEAANAFRNAISQRERWFSSEAWLSPVRRYLFLEENSHFWLGVALARQGKHEEAVAELAPLASSVESRLGTEIRGQTAAAPGTPRALEGEPDVSYYRTHFELAKSQAALGQKSKAVETLRSFLRVEQTDKASIDEARALIKTIKG